MQFYDSEIKVLNILWRYGELAAGEVAKILGEEECWKRTTTYTMLQKCIDKGYVRRSEKGFRCRATMTREETQMSSVSEQIEKSYSSKTAFFKAYLSKENLSEQEIQELLQIVDDLKK